MVTQTESELPAAHTAVVYFHGMGRQKRHEELGALIDSLDAYSYHARQQDESLGLLANIRPRIEPPRAGQKHNETFVRVNHRMTNEAGDTRSTTYRFYEAYWAPITAAGVPSWAVFKWLLWQVPTPLKTLRSRWRLRQRLRRGSLHALWDAVRASPGSGFENEDLQRILSAYNAFERPDIRREYPRGRSCDFIAYLRRENADDNVRRERLVKLARRWMKRYRRMEWANLLTLLTFVVAIAVAIGFMLGGIFVLLRELTAYVSSLGLEAEDGGGIVKALQPSWQNVMAVAASLVTLLGISRFLADYMGDVQVWATYEETDAKFKKREAIITRCVTLLQHVLQDSRVDRVVIVAHSLGTAVAMDTLLELGRNNRAEQPTNPIAGPVPLEKLDQFITFGSPIDKIHYFFESYSGDQHRYIRIVDELRGDIGEVPFEKNRKPYIHWINFWDQGDLISGPLYSPSNGQYAHLRVDNVHTSNYYFPDPAKSHTSYMKNSQVVQEVYGIIFRRERSFRTAPLIPGSGYDYESMMAGPGTSFKLPIVFKSGMFLIPWLILTCVILHVASAPAWAKYGATGLTAGLVLVLVCGWLVGARLVLNPLGGSDTVRST